MRGVKKSDSRCAGRPRNPITPKQYIWNATIHPTQFTNATISNVQKVGFTGKAAMHVDVQTGRNSKVGESPWQSLEKIGSLER
jgi:hypothetical protein